MVMVAVSLLVVLSLEGVSVFLLVVVVDAANGVVDLFVCVCFCVCCCW